MSTQIYQLNYDYEQQNGHFLVLESGETEKLTSDDLATIQVNMLKSNEIEKVLPLEIEEFNFDVRLFYRITQKRMLANVLREKPLLIHELYNLLHSIVSGIKNSSKYMLNEQNFILNDEFIFIGESLDEVYMTYLPLNQVPNKPELKMELKDLLMRLVGNVKELTGDGVQQLMNELDKEAFNLDSFETLLNDLKQKDNSRSSSQQQTNFTKQPIYKSDQQIAVTPPIRTYESTAQKDPSAEKEVNIKRRNPQSTPPLKKSQKQKQGAPATSKANQTKNASTEGDSSSKEDKGKPNLLITIVLTAFVAIVTWKLFELYPSGAVLVICIVLNILTIAGGVFYYLYKKNGGLKKKNKPVKTKKTKKSKKQKKQSATQQTNDQAAQTSVEQERTAPSVQANNQTIDEEQYFKNLRNETTVLSADPGTVLLNEAAAVQEGPYLEIAKDHGLERIVIDKDHFTIGRNPNGTDYVEDAVGISRLHFEIKMNEGHYRLKDLGSKNGTKLNGESLVPYKVYTLHDGDEITAGKATYSFKEH